MNKELEELIQSVERACELLRELSKAEYSETPYYRFKINRITFDLDVSLAKLRKAEYMEENHER